MCEEGRLNTGFDPRRHDTISIITASIGLKLEYRREVSLISEPLEFEACGEVEAREVRVWVDRGPLEEGRRIGTNLSPWEVGIPGVYTPILVLCKLLTHKRPEAPLRVNYPAGEFDTATDKIKTEFYAER